MVNERIKAFLQNQINSHFEHFKSTSVKNVVEKKVQDWRNEREDTKQKIESGEIRANPNYIKHKDEYIAWLSEAYEKSGDRIEKGLQKVLEIFQSLNFEENCKELEKRLQKTISEIQLSNPDEKLQALFFEYDHEAQFYIVPFLPDNYELQIGEKKYLNLESGDCEFDQLAELNFGFIADTVLDDNSDFRKMITETEFDDMDFAYEINYLFTYYTFLCLNTVLGRPNILKQLRKLPIGYPLYIYANEHDCEQQIVFYLEE